MPASVVDFCTSRPRTYYTSLEKPTLAFAAYREVDEAFAVAECKRLLRADDDVEWRACISAAGRVYLAAYQIRSSDREVRSESAPATRASGIVPTCPCY